MSLRGMGILNYENDKISGEKFFLKKLTKICDNSVLFDIGANVGNYSNALIKMSPNSKIYAFEPHPKTFKHLKAQAIQHNYIAVNVACSDGEGILKLYDYSGEQGGSSHASLYQDVINEIHKESSECWEVDVITIDEFVKQNNINRIKFMKIDTEGNELKVLLGAKQSIKNQIIDIIQFEFNEMNTISKVFFKDIYDFLDEYLFYRILPDGLVSLGEYDSILWEIFAYQNIVAVRKAFLPEIRKYINF